MQGKAFYLYIKKNVKIIELFVWHSSTGKVEFEIKFPAVQITSVAFGGPNLDILYVTSASMDSFRKYGDLDGSLFQVTGLGVKGLPASKVRL